MTRPNMQAARTAYEALYEGTRIETTIRHAASSLELVPALHAITLPHQEIARAAGVAAEDLAAWWRLGIVLLLYPYARHRVDGGFNFGRHVHRHAPRAERYFDVLLTQKVPERGMFVRALRTILIRTRRQHAPVDWTLLGEDILWWNSETSTAWRQGWKGGDGDEESPASGVRPAAGIVQDELAPRRASVS
ncbi:type I-E CRISPR-associated protein Cse2/CasB [Pendulispora rubella]|uniref:Type I-E CRISPR-associated protein Cse2/CasB n=1 Tax=Pendulispora rubella TaxID=2741070 RepID=A0ABZ2KV70_9BACT